MNARAKLYRVWKAMNSRCHKPDDKDYGRYGERGISVCPEWRESFGAFYSWALANGYEDGKSIDREKGDKGYEPGNCRFTDATTQTRNRSNTVTLTAFGVTKPLAEWVEDERCTVSYQTLSKRIRKQWNPEAAITTPVPGAPAATAEPVPSVRIEIRDRIVELRRVRAGDLVPNAGNWRTHPPEQRAALAAVLAEIGFAGAVIGRVQDDGQVAVIDGHMRRDMDPDSVLPVLITDLSEEEADKLLLTFDPIGAMAKTDAKKLGELMTRVRTENGSLRKMLDKLAFDTGAKVPDFQPVSVDQQGRLDMKAKVTCPNCNHEFTP